MLSEGMLALRDLHARSGNPQQRHSTSFDHDDSWSLREAPRLLSPGQPGRMTRSPEEYAVVEEMPNDMLGLEGHPEVEAKLERAPTVGPANELPGGGYANRNPFLHTVQPPERSYGSSIRSPDDGYEKVHTIPFDNRALTVRKKHTLEPPPPPMSYGRSVADPANSTPGLRSALRQSQSEYDLRRSAAELNRGGSALLEEGAGGTRAHPGVFANLLKLYGISNVRQRSHSQMTGSEGYSRSRCNSLDSSVFPTARDYRDRSRCSSMMSEGYMDMFDPDDPLVTGARVNNIDQEKHAKETVEPQAEMDKKKKRQAAIRYHIACEFDGVRLLLSY